jgi:demethylmenaquinone methyltransferase/2-methoxy-6-polyprenyl-1,4-benzoquinol methylase
VKHYWQFEMTDPRIALVHRFFSGTGATYDHIVNLCTFGFDWWWKRRILKEIPDRPTRIMDLACGTGILTFKIADRFPDCHVIGVELRDEYLDIAKEKARVMGIVNVEFILSRAEDILLEEPFDCITSSYLAKYADLPILIRKTKRMLRKGGLVLMHEFTYPGNAFFARLWELYFKVLQILGSQIYPQWKTIYYGLPELVRETQWLRETVELLEKNGFSDIRIDSLTFGASAIVTAKNG